METELWKMSAVDLASSIRQKRVSAREVIQAHLNRIAEVNGRVNAVTVVLAEQALAAADAADEALGRGDRIGPLHGVPMTVKENIDLLGSATTQGVVALADRMPPQDAPHIAQLKRAGAIPLGRTNMPDIGLRYHTDNDLRGATVNPWDESRTPGGSSGGEGVALAMGMTPLGMGNDYGGSVRLPALCAGTTALRPSRGRVPILPVYHPSGRIPFSLTLQMFNVQAPMARHAGDLRLALEQMSGYSPHDSGWCAMPLRGPSPATPIKVAMNVDPGHTGVDPIVAETVRQAAGMLADAGYAIDAVELPHFAEAARLYLKLSNIDIQQEMRFIEPLISKDALRWLRLSLELDAEATLAEYRQGWARWKALSDAWSEFLAIHPLILGPVLTTQPFKVGDDFEDSDRVRAIEASLGLTTVVNFFGLPSVAMPIQLTNGLPQGVQIIGGRFREDLCLDAAEAIEARVGVFTPIGASHGSQ